ncbi:hypothetical protein JL720_4394 [Aureococcus anophagefferens]|nr:hypothetical protein JL720_4394 [Aureococcus anophagefferens]
MPGEGKHDDDESCDDSLSLASSAPEAPPPKKSGAEGITVFLRMRPTKKPSKYYDISDAEGKKGQALKWDIPAEAVTRDGEYINNTRTKFAFKFDSILPMDIDQEQVFDRVGKHVVQNALDGYNSTIFAYGQTGSGKTFTITGGSEKYSDRGIIPRAISMIFGKFREDTNTAWTAHARAGAEEARAGDATSEDRAASRSTPPQVSYMEIYNEQGFDLLDPSHETKQLTDLPSVKMMEDENGNFHLKNLSMHRAGSEEDALNLLFLGDTNRAISETAMNQASSRSHCMFTIFLEGRRAGSDRVLRSKLHMVDLAGSERVHKTKSDGVTLREAQYINTSLFYLEMVIVALNEKKGGRVHIPYRNSMMTSVLRDSLGGNCKTVMVATCSAEKEQTEETDPFVTIRRLKGEVATLRAEVTFLKGEAGEGASLTDGERADLAEACQVYVDSRDAHETLRVSPLTLTRIKDCFAILKNMVLSAMATAAPAAAAAAAATATRPADAQERDNEIAILVNMMRVSDVGGVDFSLPPKEAAGIRDDPQKAYAYFRERCRTNGAIEDNKAVLKAKYGEAKMYGERVNSSRKSIAYLKQTIEQPAANAMEGVSGDDDDGEPPPPTAEEEKKKEAIEVEKRVYKDPTSTSGTTVLRIPINSPRYDHEAVARARAVRLGDAALNASQPKPPKLTGNEDADDDIRAFYAARRSSPCSRRSANDGRSLWGVRRAHVVVGGARVASTGRAIPRALERGERGDERGDAGDAERRRARVVVDLFRGRDLSVATAASVADSPASAAAVASSESKSDAVSAAMSASTVSVVVESVAIV